MTSAKICGVTSAQDAAAIAAAGADFIGLNFSPPSPRSLTTAQAHAVAHAARAAARPQRHALRIVGVYVDASLAAMVAHFRAGLIDIAQLHGQETPVLARSLVLEGMSVWKSCTLPALSDDMVETWQQAGVSALLLDAAVAPGEMPGGTGRAINWAHARGPIARSSLPIVLAGGLTPSNVDQAIAQARPWCVDVASGVEQTAGVKDLAKVAAFLRQTRSDSQ